MKTIGNVTKCMEDLKMQKEFNINHFGADSEIAKEMISSLDRLIAHCEEQLNELRGE